LNENPVTKAEAAAAEAIGAVAAEAGKSPRELFTWCLYDWATQGFPTVITTFVFAAYFTTVVAADEIGGTTQWAYAISASALAVAIISPLLGAIADRAGRRKPWVFAFTAVCVVGSAGLWFIRPDPAYALAALILLGIANFGFESATVFYNAMLRDLVPRNMIGRLSGWGWGAGYLGGLACLVVALLLLIRPDPPLFGLDADTFEPIRATAILVAAWLVLFAIPFFMITPDAPHSGISRGEAVRQGVATLIGTFRNIRHYGNIVNFLIARMIYTEGLNTLFTVGGIFAAVTFGMDFQQIMLFGIAMNVTAGLGALAFGWVDDWIGPKRTLFIALSCMLALGSVLLMVETQLMFWVFALPLGIFFGPAQAASRSLMARIVPSHLQAEMFGLYALSGRATAFLGPAAFGTVTAIFDSQRAGMATILVFFLVGMLILIPVKAEQQS
jgi:MFS transporter, UMF1 family